MTALTFTVAALAAYRVWRLIGVDRITAPLRDRLPSGLAWWLGCPWCSGLVVAAIIVVVYDRLPEPVWYALAAAAVVGLVGTVIDSGEDE